MFFFKRELNFGHYTNSHLGLISRYVFGLNINLSYELKVSIHVVKNESKHANRSNNKLKDKQKTAINWKRKKSTKKTNSSLET